MAIEVFNRHEKKFLLDPKQFKEMQIILAEYMEPDKYCVDGKYYTICNIYYDTEDDNIIRTSIAKPIYKEKLRLRGYGVPALDGKVYLEIKKKFNKFVNKRRTPFLLHEAYDFLDNKEVGELKPHMNGQVIKEIQHYLSLNEVYPKVYLAYDRYACFGKDDKELRISFDTNIRTRREELYLEAGDHGRSLLDDKDYHLMEIKVSTAIPMWLSKALGELEIRPRSFSKYGTEYLQFVKNSIESMEGETSCPKHLQRFLAEPQLMEVAT